MIQLSQHCLPRDPDKINQCFAVFTVSTPDCSLNHCPHSILLVCLHSILLLQDLDSSDLQNKELYIVCQVIRVGESKCSDSH